MRDSVILVRQLMPLLGPFDSTNPPQRGCKHYRARSIAGESTAVSRVSSEQSRFAERLAEWLEILTDSREREMPPASLVDRFLDQHFPLNYWCFGPQTRGPAIRIHHQHFAPGHRLMEDYANIADLIVCCHGEALPVALREKHILNRSCGKLFSIERPWGIVAYLALEDRSDLAA